MATTKEARFVEVQGTSEHGPFDCAQLDKLKSEAEKLKEQVQKLEVEKKGRGGEEQTQEVNTTRVAPDPRPERPA